MWLFAGLAAVAAFACVTAPPVPTEPLRPRESVVPEVAAMAGYLRGRTLELGGQLEDAAAAYEAALAADPESAALVQALADVWRRIGRLDIAVMWAERAFALATAAAAAEDARHATDANAAGASDAEALDSEAEDAQLAREVAREDLRDALIALLVERQDYTRAADLLAPTVDLESPELGQAIPLLGLYLHLRQTDRVETLARALIEHYPEEPSGFLAMGSVLELRSRTGEAAEWYRAALKRAPNDPRPMDQLARLARMAGDAAGEISMLERKLTVRPNDHAARSRLTQLVTGKGSGDGTIATLEAKLAQTPADREARLLLGGLYLREQRFEEGIAMLSALAVDADATRDERARALGMLGRAYLSTGQNELAVEVLARVPAEAPAARDARLLEIEALRRLDRPADALAVLDTLLPVDGRLELQVERARLLQQAGDMPGAVAAIEMLIEREPERRGDLYYELGLIHTRAGDDARALEVMLGALEIEPTHPGILNFVGYTWAEGGVRLDEAEALIRRAVMQRPDDGLIRDSLGWVLYKRGLALRGDGRKDDADDLLRGALQELVRAQDLLRPPDPTIERHIGDCHRALRQRADALAAYRRALELLRHDPDSPLARELRGEIDALEREAPPRPPATQQPKSHRDDGGNIAPDVLHRSALSQPDAVRSGAFQRRRAP
jgi:tetratricopeptide (TPR) repeat protein